MDVLARLPQGPGVEDNDQVFYGPIQAELVQERGRRCREVVLDKPPAVGVGRAGVAACARACAGGAAVISTRCTPGRALVL